jgi:long-chain acyl-CoA synthetase
VQTIDSLFRESCGTFSDRPALRHKVAGVWQEISYGALGEISDRIAAGLLRTDFRAGDHAALLAPSSPRWVAAYLGILKAGGVVVPIDKDLKSAELRHIVTDSATRVLFTASPCLEAALELAGVLPALQRIVVLVPSPDDRADPRVAQVVDALLKEWRNLVTTVALPPERVQRMELLARQVHRMFSAPDASRPDQGEIADPFDSAVSLRTRLTREGRLVGLDDFCCSASLPGMPRNGHDAAVILYTSGTTGRSKGAMLSHANIVSNILGAASHFRLDQTIHTLSFLPINHVFEQVCGILLPLSLGGRVTFCESLKKLGENLAEVKPTFFLAVPAVYRMLLDRIMKNIAAKRLSRALFALPLTRGLVRGKIRRTFGAGTIFISGGAALDPAIAAGLTRAGLTVCQGYGITETSPIISAEQPGRRRLGSVGWPLRDVEVRIDEPNEEGVGEILVKGPNIMLGYYNNPQATAEVVADGWYRTGDLGRIGDDGSLTICGRVKNLIVTPNGKNVYPEEVEHELLKSPFIAEVMVYGHHAGPAEEEIHAIIYPRQEALDEHCRSRGSCPMSEADVIVLLRSEVQAASRALADYKRVRKFTIREDEFPKTTTRKIKRYAVEASISTGG